MNQDLVPLLKSGLMRFSLGNTVTNSLVKCLMGMVHILYV